MLAMTPITEKDLEKYGIAICLLKSAMTPEQFEKWYAEELACQRARVEKKANGNGIDYAGGQ